MLKDILNLIKTALDSIKTSSDSIATAVSGIPGAIQADGTHDGYLDKDDWTTFNGKQAALTNPVTLAAAKPASATAAGTKGQMFFDGTDMYLCTATNTWIKGTLALATWG